MFKPDDLKTQLLQIASQTTGTLTAATELIGSPRQFHQTRKRRRNTRLGESMRFAVVSSVAMIGMYFLTVSAVKKITDPTTFLILGGFLNLGHLLAMAAIVGLVGRLVLRDIPLKIHLENVLYATALLPILAFLAQPLMYAQLTAYLADPHQFSFDYSPMLARIMRSSTAASVCNWVVIAGYVAFGYFMYLGLRITASVSHWRTIAVVAPSMLTIFAYQAVVIMPSTQQFVIAMTR
jgi:hypothetical protein